MEESKIMKILNLYAGIGGNRKLWGNNHEITAIEFDEKIAAIYKDLYPKDEVIIADAHQYLLDHYKQFDFIWSSPPCPTHSRTNYFLNGQGIIRYPDMKLWQEIIFLKHFFDGKYCVENVISYYEEMFNPQKMGRHYFWANFKIPSIGFSDNIESMTKVGRMNGTKKTLNGETTHTLRKKLYEKSGFDLSKYDYADKEKLLNNCVSPEIGLSILERAMGVVEQNNFKQIGLFKDLTF